MTDLTPSELKALFDQLVSAVGTHEAAATFLGVSRQRIGQLISTSSNDLPTWAQVAKLEQVCGQSVVFGALARRVENDGQQNALAAAIHSTSTAARAVHLAHEATADGMLEPGEIDRMQDSAREHLAAAQRHFDATMALQPTRMAVV